MGDFLIDFRPAELRRTAQAAEFLKFFPDMSAEAWDDMACGVVLTSPDDPALWGSYRTPDGMTWVGLCGRIALEQPEWAEARRIEGEGGLACKFIYRCYRQGGLEKLGPLNGHFVILLFDRAAEKSFIVTDRWGLAPAFQFDAGGQLVYSSHPDALADAVDEERNWDLTSFAEFILAGKLTPPFTYYKRIHALPVGSVTTIELDRQNAFTHSYFKFQSDPQPDEKIDALAEEFAAAWKKSVAKRTAPLPGRTAVALSGGLDSRVILAASPAGNELISFTCYDVENREFRIARALAGEMGVAFVPLRRSFDYYADHASLGVKISAGMGCIASNHFLGFRRQLRELGVQNLLTGCYCDYVFKGLALNKRVNPWTTRERLGAFDFSYYGIHFDAGTELSRAVCQRLEERFPAELRQDGSELTALRVEQRRIFPLCYEVDNTARSVPQRTMGWYIPVAENDLMAVHLKMSCAMRLNQKLFARMVTLVCSPRVCRIPDANTGAPVNASPFREIVHARFREVERLGRKLKPSHATTGSWPNWNHYLTHSPVIKSLWSTPNPDAWEIFRQVLGRDGFKTEISAYKGDAIYIFLQLFTLKLWFDQRARS